ncbi:uncharacterized protein LOC100382131 isoform 2 [Zea mays]|jgi:hypothetical protein|uniref:Uncharacterized protein n=1 Tax=Zea mays TaxID=4577 RepID=C0P4Q1_MAIZE|nr:uncharacterized protein LOC100382131 isoform 2 [Zea mays]ACN27967.1 unknown [Zea mays]|eukprot:NP_001168363.1 uncharacterized protein LOC100382131 isoform 2 [Zea mays]
MLITITAIPLDRLDQVSCSAALGQDNNLITVHFYAAGYHHRRHHHHRPGFGGGGRGFQRRVCWASHHHRYTESCCPSRRRRGLLGPGPLPDGAAAQGVRDPERRAGGAQGAAAGVRGGNQQEQGHQRRDGLAPRSPGQRQGRRHHGQGRHRVFLCHLHWRRTAISSFAAVVIYGYYYIIIQCGRVSSSFFSCHVLMCEKFILLCSFRACFLVLDLRVIM